MIAGLGLHPRVGDVNGDSKVTIAGDGVWNVLGFVLPWLLLLVVFAAFLAWLLFSLMKGPK